MVNVVLQSYYHRWGKNFHRFVLLAAPGEALLVWTSSLPPSRTIHLNHFDKGLIALGTDSTVQAADTGRHRGDSQSARFQPVGLDPASITSGFYDFGGPADGQLNRIRQVQQDLFVGKIVTIHKIGLKRSQVKPLTPFLILRPEAQFLGQP